jgi:hypothetical protein
MNHLRRALPALLALAVGLIYAFPNLWWLATSPNYSILRGYILSDDDMAPYAAALSDARSHPLPPLTAYHRAYETRTALHYFALSNWLTNLLFGNLLRLVGTLERLVPLGLFLSGVATFLLLYLLARRLVTARAGALLAALFACFRYPFYASLVAAGRQALTGGGLDWARVLHAAFPGMVNGYMLYPLIRWPVPGLVFFWFLLAVLGIMGLARSTWEADGGPFPIRRVVLLGVWVGLAAYVYFFFWSFLVALLALLTMMAWLMQRRRLVWAMLGAGAVAGAVSAMFWLAATGSVRLGLPAVLGAAGTSLAPAGLDPETLLIALSVHGLLAFAVLLAPVIARSPLSTTAASQRPVLFGLHLAVVLLAAVNILSFGRLQAWHWSRHMMDCLAPLTVAWLLALALRRAPEGAARPVPRWAWGLAGLGVALAVFTRIGLNWPGFKLGSLEATGRTLAALALLVPGMVALSVWPGRRWSGAGAVAVTGVAWVLYHRSVPDVSWAAFVPLGIWAAGRKPRLLLAACAGFTVLNVALGATLQLAVRPWAAQPFFSQRAEITEALRWLDEHTPLESVVTTEGWLGDSLVRGYTHNLTLAIPNWWTDVPTADRQRRRLVQAAIYAVPAETLAERQADYDEIVADFKSKVNEQWIGDESMDFLVDEQVLQYYDPADYATLAERPLAQLLTTYRVDYVWVGPWERHDGRRDFAGAPEVALVYQNDLVQIYKVRR